MGGGLGSASCRGGEPRILDSPKKHGWRRSSSCAECPCLLASPWAFLATCSNAQMIKCSCPDPISTPPQIFAKCNLFLQVGGKTFLFAVISVQAFSSKVIISSPLIFSCVIWIAPLWVVILSSYATAVKQKHSQVSNACYFPIRLELFLDCLRLVSDNDKSIDPLLATISRPLEDFPGSMI